MFAITVCVVPKTRDPTTYASVHNAITGEYVYVTRVTLTSAARRSRFLVLSAPRFALGMAMVLANLAEQGPPLRKPLLQL